MSTIRTRFRELQQLEEYVMENANKLGIGTMGFGGQVTLLGCKVGVMNRLPASFFVSVAYNCWAYRRQGVLLNARAGEIKAWIYPSGSDTPMKNAAAADAAAEAVTDQRRAPRSCAEHAAYRRSTCAA